MTLYRFNKQTATRVNKYLLRPKGSITQLYLLTSGSNLLTYYSLFTQILNIIINDYYILI